MVYSTIVIKIGGAYAAAVNEMKSWSDLGGWPGFWRVLVIGALVSFFAYVAWMAGKFGKQMDDEIDRRWGLKS